MPDWLRDLRPAAGAEEALPDWFDELGVEEQPASESMAVSTSDSALDWLSRLGGELSAPYIRAAFEMALLDIAGKAYGIPVYRLLGGRARDHDLLLGLTGFIMLK